MCKCINKRDALWDSEIWISFVFLAGKKAFVNYILETLFFCYLLYVYTINRKINFKDLEKETKKLNIYMILYDKSYHTNLHVNLIIEN